MSIASNVWDAKASTGVPHGSWQHLSDLERQLSPASTTLKPHPSQIQEVNLT
jgi:hypothetical protein